MWKQDGGKLTGNYGTWRGQEVELWSLRPYGGMLTIVTNDTKALIDEGGNEVLLNRSVGTPFAYTLKVPADEVTNRHKVRVKGRLGPGRSLRIMAEDEDGNLAVESIDPMDSMYKRLLINNHGFTPFSENEPLEHVSVSGWLPAERIRDISIEIIPLSDD
ncbi:hypothetical protein [Arthrobacter sp.]|uniref:hypothetical protein n=1 Tax=Arthrobacter sp. TaxID=1667 RepID=UPI0028985E90|nr:hypothetical protein [Arthrobacter sp.]